MNKSNNISIVKTIGTGLLAGMIVGYAGGKMSKPKAKNKIGKALGNVGDLVDNVCDFFR